LMKYKKEPISDRRFREHLILPANDPHFNSFNAYVNDACDECDHQRLNNYQSVVIDFEHILLGPFGIVGIYANSPW
jgi:hypothetical protein